MKCSLRIGVSAMVTGFSSVIPLSVILHHGEATVD
jgi:hypothetical protein